MIDTQATSDRDNKRKILKSTSMIGGSSLINILIGMVRTKFVAVLLGPNGVGFMGVLTNLQQLLSSICCMGVNSSGVQQIARKTSANDARGLGITVKAIRIFAWISGIGGLALLACLSPVWSQLSFKSDKYTIPIAILGLSILFSIASTFQVCTLQGFRRIDYVAKINIFGAVVGTVVGLPCYYFWRVNGVVPSLILASLASLAVSSYYARSIQIERQGFDRQAIRTELQKLLGIGLPLMLATMATTATSFFIRVLLSREAGLEAAGLYQSAFTLAGVLVNFVLGAMGTDYYPKLVSFAQDNTRIQKEVNQQLELSLLLSVPALLGTVLYMPIVIRVLYSSKFFMAIPIMRWAIFGILGRIVSWPLSYVVLAKSKNVLFLIVEVASGIVNLGLVYVCYKLWGLQGCGIAFALLYFFYLLAEIIIVKRLAVTRYSASSFRFILTSTAILVGMSIFVDVFSTMPLVKYAIGSVFFLVVVFFYIRRLLSELGLTISALLARILRKSERKGI